MADKKISQLSAVTALDTADEFAVVDKSDTSQASSGTTKRSTLATLRTGIKRTLTLYPEEYGAVGDGATNDTSAIQQMITWGIALDKNVDFMFDAKTYLVNSAPRTDKSGYSILSLTDTWKSQKKLRFIGSGCGAIGGDSAYNDLAQPAKTIIRTDRTGDAYSGTYGPPSVIGAATDENGADLTGVTNWIGTIKMENIAIRVPLNPEIAAIDALTFGGFDAEDVEVFASNDGTGGDAAAAPTHPHAFGIRWPARWNNGVNIGKHVHVAQMYAAHVFWHTDHHRSNYNQSWRCPIGLGFQTGGDGTGGVYPLILTYFGAQGTNNVVAGWDPTTGAADLPWDIYMHNSVIQTEAGSAPFNLVKQIKDTNNKLKGNITIHYFNGLGVDNGPLAIDGGQNASIKSAGTGAPSVASATTLTIPPDSDYWTVSAANTITGITASYAGREVTLRFSSTAQVSDGNNIKLAASANFTGGADRILKLVSDGTNWLEVARSAN